MRPHRILAPVTVTCLLGVLAATAAAQCDPTYWQPESSQPRGGRSGSLPWDPDGAGPLAPQLVTVGGQMYGVKGDWVPAQITRWDGTTLVNMAQGFERGQWVSAAVDWNGTLVIGGIFHYVSWLEFNNVTYWSQTWQSWQPMGAGFQNVFEPYVSELIVYDGQVIAGGRFDQSGPTTLGNIARWNGASWEPMGFFNDSLKNFVIYEGDLIALGDFSVVDGQPAVRVARWHDGAWHAMGQGLGWLTEDLVVWNGQLLALDREGQPHIRRWDGSQWQNFGPPLPAAYDVLFCTGVDAQGRLYVGGRSLLLRWNEASQGWDSIGGFENMWVGSLAVFGPELVVSGFGAHDDTHDVPDWGRWLENPVPWVLVPPAPVEASAWGAATFTATPFIAGYDADGPVTYAWTRDGAPVSNGAGGASAGGGTVSGAGTPTLTIDAVRLSDAGEYRFVVANGCGASESDAAELTVINSCPADFNGDGTVNSTDVSDFINAWFEDQLFGTFVADWDGNGVVNSTDVSAFINDWFEDTAAGCL